MLLLIHDEAAASILGNTTTRIEKAVVISHDTTNSLDILAYRCILYKSRGRASKIHMGKRKLRIGVKSGGGPPPGYKWNVVIPNIAVEEAYKSFGDDGYWHLAMQVQELAREDDPTHPSTLSVDAIANFHELRESGGVLGNVSARVFFHVNKETHVLLILGTIKKKNNGATRTADRLKMARRLRRYLRGEFDESH